MKVISKDQLNHQQLKSQTSGELYSLSAVVSGALGSKQLFIHHDIIQPSLRSSGAHRHTVVEEVVYILKGTATIISGERETNIGEGSFVLFDPKEMQTHHLINKSDQTVETITFSISAHFDLVVFERSSTAAIKRPSSHFDQDLSAYFG